jgi:hypothetical protein
MNLRDAKRSLRGLTLDQLRKLDVWLHELVEQTDIEERVHPPSGNKASVKKQVRQKTYRLQSVRCGSKRCRCASGYLHGPYWYAYWSKGGKVRSQYIGKKLPRGVKPQRSSKSRGVR